MADLGSRTAINRPGRRWSFANCTFDEGDWSLTVDGQRVAVESKPLEILRELLLRPGSLVTKDELLDAIWPNVFVVEASLPTAVHKLRVALGQGQKLIETVPGIGYRFVAPVEVEESAGAPESDHSRAAESKSGGNWPKAAIPFAIFGLLAVVAVAFLTIRKPTEAISNPGPHYTTREVEAAIRRLDVDKVESMIEAGWQPDTPINPESDTPLGLALQICEWDPAHDRRRLQMMVRTLLDGGARLDHRNAFGDTPYSIAKARRFCGPDHPVTQMIRRLCGQGLNAPGDGCMASYELARGEHFTLQP